MLDVTHKPHFYGHRKRLKEKFIETNNTEHIPDYELLELMLFGAMPRKDVKPLAKELLAAFNGLCELMHTPKDKFLSLQGTTEAIYVQIAVTREIIRRVLRGDITKKNIISSWSALMAYLRVTMGYIKTEQFRLLFLNKKNVLIADEEQTIGTIDQTAIYPREVVKRVLFYEASSIIMVHNHPSGNPRPSESDVQLTKKIFTACESVNVRLHDHVIICRNEVYSFKNNRLL